MTITERSRISRPASIVWRYLVTPELFLKWNPKVTYMDAAGAFHAGQRFSTRYIMSNREIQCISTVTTIVEHQALELQHRNCVGRNTHQDLEVTERFTLEENNGETTVTKEIIMRNHDIPWYFLPLVYLVTRFGKPTGPDPLKQLCEREP